ncbi:cytochrome P450 6l1-like [Aphidius gifuensis]|uniref:cytochrome P450 6l1-like n=1 Tax=Aphidius gifuensis TaxID=684658 RepID=UPI001CDBFDFB|nr:cytochrome P450 6l1-like [Aphidius gifuensis]
MLSEVIFKLLVNFIIFSSITIFVWLVIKIFNHKNYWYSQKIPYIKGNLPVIGNMWSLITRQESFVTMYEKFYRTHPEQSMIGFYNFQKPCLLIRDPELIKIVMHTEFTSFDKNISSLDRKLDPLLSSNPFFTFGDEWKIHRKIMNNGLSNKRLKLIAQQISNISKKFSNYLNDNIKDEIVVEAVDFFSSFTAEVTATCGFGIDGKSFDKKNSKNFKNVVKKLIEPNSTQVMSELIGLFFPVLRKLFQIKFIPHDIDGYFREIIHDVIEARKISPLIENDYLQQAIEFYNSENEIVGHAASFFLNGHLTSSFAIAFTVLQIASHQKVQDKLRQEAKLVLQKHGGEMNYECLQELKYFDKVINESIRLFPPLGFLGKVCTQEYNLTGSDGLHVCVKPGTDIIISVLGLHRDPHHWTNPNDFNPDRFNNEDKYHHKYSHLGFGAGSRICVGMRVAMLQIKASLATLLIHCSLEIDSKTKIPVTVSPMSSLFTFTDGGIWIRIKALKQ